MQFLIPLLIGGAIGTLTGFFGAGGGFILTPSLNLFLGLDMVLAVGTGAAQICVASLSTLIMRLNRSLEGLSVALWCALGIFFPGSWLGTRLVSWLKAQGPRQANICLLSLFVILLFWIAFSMIRNTRKKDAGNRPGLLQKVRIPPYCVSPALPHGPFSIPVLVLLGIIMGFLSGLLGIGGGVIMLPILIYLVGQPAKSATLTSTILVFLSGTSSAAFHYMDNHVALNVLIPLVLGAVPGTALGVRLQKRCCAETLKRRFVWVVILAWIMVVFKLTAEIFHEE